jgi:Cu-Zn family superoxide dismutase
MCTNAIAYFEDKNVKGSVQFHQCKGKNETIISFDLNDMIPNKTMACHIHEYGDKSDGCTTLGAHWNPKNKEHGSIYIDIDESHAGDLINNIKSDRYGKFNYQYIDPRVQLIGNVKMSVLGRSVVIHDGIDDLGQGMDPTSKTTGNAGGRMACAIIGHSNNIC